MSLNENSIANDSYVDVDSIGSDETGALHCHINRTDCCSGSVLNEFVEGDWYYPNGTVIGMAMADKNNVNTASFISNRTQDELLLFQNTGSYSATERGRFYCVIHDGLINQTLYVNIICELHVLQLS